MDATHKRIARNIRQLAEAKKVLLTHLPDKAGVGRSSFFAFMAGKASGKAATVRSPTVRWLEKIADALGVDVAELLRK